MSLSLAAMGAGPEGASGPSRRVKELLQRSDVGPTPAAQPSVGATSSRELKRKRDEDLQAAGGPSIKANKASVAVRNSPTTTKLCPGTNLRCRSASRSDAPIWTQSYDGDPYMSLG